LRIRDELAEILQELEDGTSKDLDQRNGMEPRYERRLSDRISTAFFEACRIGNLDAARHLLIALEYEVQRSIRLRRDKREDGDDLAIVRARLELELLRQASGDHEGGAIPLLSPQETINAK